MARKARTTRMARKAEMDEKVWKEPSAVRIQTSTATQATTTESATSQRSCHGFTGQPTARIMISTKKATEKACSVTFMSTAMLSPLWSSGDVRSATRMSASIAIRTRLATIRTAKRARN